jgi:hypothetical protein
MEQNLASIPRFRRSQQVEDPGVPFLLRPGEWDALFAQQVLGLFPQMLEGGPIGQHEISFQSARVRVAG